MVEHEIKLSFASADAAREAVRATGARLVVPRRLVDDQLFDTADAAIARSGTSLRLRRDGASVRLTVKGPLLGGPVKSREERETPVSDADTVERMLAMLGYRPVLRAEKYREEYALDAVHLAVDEAPFGAFVEIEGAAPEIAKAAALLGRTPEDYRLESYVALWRQHCRERGVTRPLDMTFANATAV